MSLLKEFLKADLYRYSKNTNTKNFLYYFFKVPSYNYTVYLRYASIRKRKSILGLILRYIVKRKMIKYGIQIPSETKIGPGFRIGHFGNIVVNKESVIGANCSISQGVTLGQTNRGSRKGAPSLGDRVWVGANAVIVGKITVGNDVLIAPNAYVNKDVPANSVVIGNPAEIRPSENAVEGYINQTYTPENWTHLPK